MNFQTCSGQKRKHIELEIISQISKSITIEMSFAEMMQNVIEKLKSVIAYDLLSFCVLEEDNRLVIKSAAPQNVEYLTEGEILEEENSAAWRVIREQNVLLRTDVLNDESEYSEDVYLNKLGLRSTIIVPLFVKNKNIGTLNLGSTLAGAYDLEDAAFLQQVANQMAVFMESARLYAEEKRLKLEWQKSYKTSRTLMDEMLKRNTQLEIINQIAKSITVEMSFGDMLESIAEKLQRIVSYDLLSFCLLEASGLIIKNSLPKKQEILAEGTVLDPVNSAPAQAIKNKLYFIRPDIKNDVLSFEEDEDLLKLGISSGIMVPLLVKNRVIGALNLGSKRLFAYSQEHGEFLQHVADHLAISIENSRLYAEESEIKAEWEETFRAVTDMIYLIDPNYRLLKFNDAVTEYGRKLGHDIQVGETCYKYFGAAGEEQCSECPAQVVFRDGKTLMNRRQFKDGTVWEVYFYPSLNNQGKVNKVISLIKDVTKRAQLEAQLVQSAKLAAIGEIAAGIAHELNSPLTAIIGNSLLLEEEMNTLPSDHRELLESIKNCGLRCKTIINSLRDFARQDKYELSRININDIVSSALNLVVYQIEKNRISISSELAPDVRPVLGSRQHLEQLLINLILNARDAVENSLERRIHITTGNDLQNHTVYVSVTDTGCGMDQNEIEKIFNPFFTTKEVSKGTGLGLSISKRIAEEHNGRIEVVSHAAAGSTFTLVIPQG